MCAKKSSPKEFVQFWAQVLKSIVPCVFVLYTWATHLVSQLVAISAIKKQMLVSF